MTEKSPRDQPHDQPLVSVITPVYNGEKHLAECVESVLAQTYQHWEYVIVDNCSSDRSSEIAHQYAQRDARIRVRRNQRFVSAIQNHHVGFGHMAPDSKYCKVLHADDWIFPDCLRQMVALAEAQPTVGIVSAYRLEGEWVALGGLPHPSNVVSGREICRLTLLRWAFVFGSPTSLLLRSECIRGGKTFYDEEHFPQHSDTAACLEVLQSWDFGFVHQVLTYTRHHAEAKSAFSRRVNSYLAEGVAMLMKYGPLCLSPSESNEAVQQWTRSYRRFLAVSLLQRRSQTFWDYHKTILDSLGWSLGPMALFGALISDTVDVAISRFTAVRNTIRLRLTS
jgi:Glycosyltransferases involved in cell wall biogenesis